MKKTLVLGATTNPAKYGYIATSRLKSYGHEVIPVGIRKGEIEGIAIHNDFPIPEDLDTITLYLNLDIILNELLSPFNFRLIISKRTTDSKIMKTDTNI